ncbi:MAG TPA: hypothetical protein VMV50_00305 [Candidatus Paceibacterota bacterium]|nr:hypothetical protein [Candidatus Paceibacterota bacterium]
MAKDKIMQMLEDQENRIKRTRVFVNSRYSEKVVIKDGKIVSVNLSSSEMKDWIEIEERLMRMERLLVGLPEKM